MTVVGSASLVGSSKPASLFKSSSAFADTGLSMKLYTSAAFRILGPQDLQTRLLNLNLNLNKMMMMLMMMMMMTMMIR